MIFKSVTDGRLCITPKLRSEFRVQSGYTVLRLSVQKRTILLRWSPRCFIYPDGFSADIESVIESQGCPKYPILLFAFNMIKNLAESEIIEDSYAVC